MFGLNNELAVEFILPHGCKASDEDSILDGVCIEAQVQSLGVNACQLLAGWLVLRRPVSSA
jgi:hypothetical protein